MSYSTVPAIAGWYTLKIIWSNDGIPNLAFQLVIAWRILQNGRSVPVTSVGIAPQDEHQAYRSPDNSILDLATNVWYPEFKYWWAYRVGLHNDAKRATDVIVSKLVSSRRAP